jgi:hypothetical protein
LYFPPKEVKRGRADDAKNKLVNLVKSTRFRPRAIDGELARAAPVAVRYYLGD